MFQSYLLFKSKFIILLEGNYFLLHRVLRLLIFESHTYHDVTLFFYFICFILCCFRFNNWFNFCYIMLHIFQYSVIIISIQICKFIVFYFIFIYCVLCFFQLFLQMNLIVKHFIRSSNDVLQIHRIGTYVGIYQVYYNFFVL